MAHFGVLFRSSKTKQSLNKIGDSVTNNKQIGRIGKVRRIGVNKSKGMIIWLYSTSYFIFTLLILSLNSVIPIDVIVQSKTNNSHLAVNTIIILILCVVFLVLSIVLHLFRLFYTNLHLQDIPKPYIPTTESDIDANAAEYIQSELVRCQEIKKKAGPRGKILHPGLYHFNDHNKFDEDTQENGENGLPNNIIYENVIRVIGEDIKYKSMLNIKDSFQLKVDNHLTLREILNSKFSLMQTELSHESMVKLDEFLNHYERLRFSGEPINYNDFIRFLELWNYLKNVIYRYKKV